MEAVMAIEVGNGKFYFPVCQLPEPVANAWIDYLGEDRKSSEPISTLEWAQIDGDLGCLHIAYINDDYYLITDPSTED